ncbi:alpha/beta hydrolase [Mycobacterium shimoidei]|nr:alpha/beta hydrolase [Mycobacterium shimoidei]
MTAPPAWPEVDETTLLDAAQAFDADQKAVDDQLWVFQRGSTRLFDDDAWSGQAANAARTKHQQQIAALQAHVQGSAAAAKLYRDSASVVISTKQQIIENVENAQKLINRVANDAQATAEQKDFFIKSLVKQTHAENVELVQAGAARLGKPPASPITVRPASNGREVPLTPSVDGPSRSVPEDPKQFHDWWQSLTREQKDQLYRQDRNIGNHPGMPWDPSDQLGKNHYNQLHLTELRQQAQANVDRLQRQADELARQAYMGNHDSAAQLHALLPQLAAAKHDLDGYNAVQAELNKKGPQRYLGLIDDQGHAAIAIGNPDMATRNAIFVPGTGQDLPTIGGADAKATAMYNAAHDADPRQTVAVTTWMGYDRPMDVFEARHPDAALAGASALDAFESGQRASHVGSPSVDTVIGHSYGSTLVGAAASGGHHLDANNIIAVGSPGVLVDHAAELSLDPGAHVYAMRAQNDIIGLGRIATEWTLGGDPMAPNFGATRLEAAPGPTWPGGLPSIPAHSSYWDLGNPALANMGSVIAHVPPPYVIGQAR